MTIQRGGFPTGILEEVYGDYGGDGTFFAWRQRYRMPVTICWKAAVPHRAFMAPSAAWRFVAKILAAVCSARPRTYLEVFWADGMLRVRSRCRTWWRR